MTFLVNIATAMPPLSTLDHVDFVTDIFKVANMSSFIGQYIYPWSVGRGWGKVKWVQDVGNYFIRVCENVSQYPRFTYPISLNKLTLMNFRQSLNQPIKI